MPLNKHKKISKLYCLKLKVLLLKVLQRNENQWPAVGEYLQIISHIKIRGQCRDYMKKPINSYRKDKKIQLQMFSGL